MPEPPFARHCAFVTFVAILVLAGLAHLTGAPDLHRRRHCWRCGLAGFLRMICAPCASNSRTAAIIWTRTTARSRAEIETLADRMWELQESEERFRGLIDALGDLVVHRDRDGCIVYANKVFADLVGIDQRDLAGQHALRNSASRSASFPTPPLPTASA